MWILSAYRPHCTYDIHPLKIQTMLSTKDKFRWVRNLPIQKFTSHKDDHSKRERSDMIVTQVKLSQVAATFLLLLEFILLLELLARQA